jgi:hypothetical protein
VTDGTTTKGRPTAWVIDTDLDTASPRLSVDNVLSQTDPDEWEENPA